MGVVSQKFIKRVQLPHCINVIQKPILNAAPLKSETQFFDCHH